MKLFKYSFFFYLLCFLHIFLGINGTIGGILLILKSDGSLLGMETGWLIHSPFNNYIIPGLLLFLFLGTLPLLIVSGLVKKMSWQKADALNIYKNRHWAWTFSLYEGIISITWITVQLVLTQYFWIQPVIIIIGLLIIICTMIPGVIKQFESNGINVS